MSFAKIKLFRFYLHAIVFHYLETDWQLVCRFHRAVIDGDVTTVDRMLRDGMPVNASDGGGWTALQIAARRNRIDVARLLLDKGADVSRQDPLFKGTLLHYTARRNHTEVARLLIDNGADINKQNCNNETPLDVARKGSEVELLLLQLQQSAP